MLTAARSEIGGRGVRDPMEASYHRLVTLPSALRSYQRFFRGLLGDHPTPAQEELRRRSLTVTPPAGS